MRCTATVTTTDAGCFGAPEYGPTCKGALHEIVEGTFACDSAESCSAAVVGRVDTRLL